MNEADLTPDELELLKNYRTQSPEQRRYMQRLGTRLLTRQARQTESQVKPTRGGQHDHDHLTHASRKHVVTLRHNNAAWREGFEAGERGVLSTRCPYPATTVESWSWSSGHVEGKAKRDGFSYSKPQD